MLVVDDERAIRRALEINLSVRGYEVDAAATGEDALVLAARNHPDVVILDLGLPGISGRDVIEGLRGWTAVPIIVLSARRGAREGDRARRGRRRLRHQAVRNRRASRETACRAAPGAERSSRDATVETPDFVIDFGTKRVTRNGEDVHLTPTEWHLLETLVRHHGKLVPQKHLLREVWGPEYGDETHYLRVFMGQLRRKLEPEPSRPKYLITEPGMGYRFELPDES